MKIRIQKDFFFISFLLLISFLFLFPLLPPGFYESHDGDAHVARFAAYYHAFQDGQFPPRWAGNFNFGYGTPVFIFYYPLPGWIASLLHTVGISFENTFKLLISIGFIAAPITFYLWTKQLFRQEVAFLGGLLYGFMPYHFLNLYVRGDVAEVLAYALVPLVFLSIEQMLQQNKQRIIGGGIFYGLLILAHNGVSLLFTPVLLLYWLLRSKTKQQLLEGGILFSIGFALAAFFWIPALYESRYTNADLFIGDMYKKHFPTINELIISPWGFGPNVRDLGGLSPQIGIVPLLFVVGSLFAFRVKKNRKQLLGWLLFFCFAVFITLPVSSWVWETLPLIKKIQFPWRFVGLASFAVSVLSCYLFSLFRSKQVFIVYAVLILIVSLPLVQVKNYVSYPDSYYESYTGTTDYHGAASTLWTAGDPGSVAKSPVEVINGEGAVTELSRKTNEHQYIVTARTPVTILDNTHYYPGWKVLVDGKDTPIQFQDANNPGLISFPVPRGNHTVQVVFTETSLRQIANIISMSTVIVLLFLGFFFRQRRWS